MDKSKFNGFLVSNLIVYYYNLLAAYTISGSEDNKEFMEYLDILRTLTILENEEYNKFSLDYINGCLDIYNNNEYTSNLSIRCYHKLCEHKNILLNSPMVDNNLLSSVIDTKIMIDTFDLIDKKIDLIFYDNTIDTNLKIDIINSYAISKYNYFSLNSYSEKMALDYNYDIKNIPKINFIDINKNNPLDMNDLKGKIIYYIIESMDYLTLMQKRVNGDDAYESIFEMARIETLLSYLNNIDLLILDAIIDDEYDPKGDYDTLDIVNKLIRKKREN